MAMVKKTTRRHIYITVRHDRALRLIKKEHGIPSSRIIDDALTAYLPTFVVAKRLKLGRKK